MSSKKINATQIAKGDLEVLGKRIGAQRGYEAKAHEKAGVELRKADDHFNTITQLLADAKAKCDAGGFEAFKRKYCPDLGRSRIYELLAIGSGKKTFEQLRTEKRASVAKSRKKVSTTSPPVVDKPEPARPTVKTKTEEEKPTPKPAKVKAAVPVVADDPEASAAKRKAENAALDKLAGESTDKLAAEEVKSPAGLDIAAYGAKQIGESLERLGADRFFDALQFAPKLKAEIERRAIGVCAKKKTTTPEPKKPEPKPGIDYAKDILGLEGDKAVIFAPNVVTNSNETVTPEAAPAVTPDQPAQPTKSREVITWNEGGRDSEDPINQLIATNPVDGSIPDYLKMHVGAGA